MSGADWMPGVQRDPQPGGLMEGQPWRSMVWHTSESGTSPSAIYGVADWVKRQRSEYHVLWNPHTGQFLQLIAASQSARALKNAPSGYRSNRKGTRLIQVCVIGRTADRPLAGGSPLREWPRLRSWLDSHGIPHTDRTRSGRSYSEFEASGIHTHGTTPGNTHTDPGPIEFAALYPPAAPAAERQRPMIVVRPSNSGTQYLVGFTGSAGIANGEDSAQLRQALSDPQHVAVISPQTFDAIRSAMA